MTDKNNSIKPQSAVVLMLGLVALSGCNQVGQFDLSSTSSALRGMGAPAYKHTISEHVSIGDAFVRLPADAGRVVEVAQTRYGNGVEQLVIYQGDSATRGENAALIKMAVHIDGKKQAESLSIGSSSAGRIASDLRKALPGVHMQISNEVHTNAYGPFGYALGRAPGKVRCIYGWQQMKGSKNDRWAVFKRSSQKPRLSIRLRVCRSGVTNRQLVGLMQNMQVNADPAAVLRPTAVSWNAGASVRSTGALPRYDRSGYVSQQREAYEEPVRETKVKRVKRPRIVKRARVITETRHEVPVVQTYQVQKQSSAAVYSPPLPDQYTPTGKRSDEKTIVPVPSKSTPATSSSLVTARTYTPEKKVEKVSTSPVAESDTHSAVPLPN